VNWWGRRRAGHSLRQNDGWENESLLLRLFSADFAQQLFAAQFVFFFDDNFAEPGPARFQ
jgi:hypothetical protein